MDERHRRNADEKIGALYDELLGTLTKKGAITELREMARENRDGLAALRQEFADHKAEQSERDERGEERAREVRHLLLNVMERSVLTLLGALGGAWVAIQAFFSASDRSGP